MQLCRPDDRDNGSTRRVHGVGLDGADFTFLGSVSAHVAAHRAIPVVVVHGDDHRSLVRGLAGMTGVDRLLSHDGLS